MSEVMKAAVETGNSQETPNADKGQENQEQSQQEKPKTPSYEKPEDAYKDHPWVQPMIDRERERASKTARENALKDLEEKQRKAAEEEEAKKKLEAMKPEEREKAELRAEIEDMKKVVQEIKGQKAAESFKANVTKANLPEGLADLLRPDVDLEKVKALIPEIIKAANKGNDINPPKRPDGLPALTPEEKRAAKVSGMTEEEYSKEKAELLKTGGGPTYGNDPNNK